jgi:hypothetical protein
MIDTVIENFTKGFFVGVVGVSFFEMGGQKNIQITFSSKDDMVASFHRAKDRYIADLFVIDMDNKTWMGNRDYYETAMYMTAVVGATDAWSQEFERRVKEEREEEENEDNKDDDN